MLTSGMGSGPRDILPDKGTFCRTRGHILSDKGTFFVGQGDIFCRTRGHFCRTRGHLQYGQAKPAIVNQGKFCYTNRPMSPVGSLGSALQSFIKIGSVVLEI